MASLELFRLFVAVYRAGSVSGAARDRHLTQPAVSAQIAALEARVGEPLFRRTPRGMQPTERGQLLYAQVEAGVDQLHAADRTLRGYVPGALPLRVGGPVDALRALLPALCGGAGAAAGLHLSVAPDAALLTGLREGSLDAVLASRVPDGRALSAAPVADVPFTLIVPVGWEAAPLEPAALGAWLNARPWVSYSVERPTTRRWFAGTLGVRFAARAALTVPDLAAVVQAVGLGAGASLVPRWAALDAQRSGQVTELELPGAGGAGGTRWALLSRAADERRPELLALVGALRHRAACLGVSSGS
ncbi:LysR family transcriptional regulator [Deinococcus grandis]|nr:LysR family transcriptional regulator [Deinococcus grandis]